MEEESKFVASTNFQAAFFLRRYQLMDAHRDRVMNAGREAGEGEGTRRRKGSPGVLREITKNLKAHLIAGVAAASPRLAPL